MKIEEQVKKVLGNDVCELTDPQDAFKNKLLKKAKGEYKKEIIIKFGVDPTQPDIHLGHAVILKKLRAFQNLGCKVVFLVGDFTARIGDPTGKSKVRPDLEQQQVEENLATYIQQVGKILKTDPESYSWIRNSDWFIGVTDLQPKGGTVQWLLNRGFNPQTFIGKAALYDRTRMQVTHLKKSEVHNVTLLTLLNTMRRITYGRLIQRDMFQERIDDKKELRMHEVLYPVLQGVDSYLIHQIYGSCDMEIGGSDQTFNMHMGRDVMKINHVPQQTVMSIELLKGTDGHMKMGKSQGNYIGINTEPNDMYGRLMSIPDDLITHYLRLSSYMPTADIEKIDNDLSQGKGNPRDVKMQMAEEIVAIYHGLDAAKIAGKAFVEIFQEKNVPKDMKEIFVAKNTPLVDISSDNNLLSSRSEFRRKIEEGAIKEITNDSEEKINDPNFSIEEDTIIKIGKKLFVSIKIQ